jgi:D-proline reductase (dithiol) PrdB
MVRLADIPTEEAAHLLAKVCDPFDTKPWVTGPPLATRRIALLTSAGLHRIGDPAFAAVDLSYRVIPGTTRANTLTMTHSSVHFDRTGFREDVNVVFPIDRLHELASAGVGEELGEPGISPKERAAVMRALGTFVLPERTS